MSAQPATIHEEAFACANCSAPSQGEYCSRCGQKRVHEGDLSFAHAWHHLIHETLHLDGRIFTTVKLLFTRPGVLTLDFLEGRRARHVHPIRLFLVFSAVFFLVGPAVLTALRSRPRAARPGAEVQAGAPPAAAPSPARDGQVARQQLSYKAGFVLGQMAAGLAAFLLFRRRWRHVPEHLVMALHWACFAMAAHTVAGGLSMLLGKPTPFSPVALTLSVWYLFLAARRVYAGEPQLLLKTVSLFLVMFTVWAGTVLLVLKTA